MISIPLIGLLNLPARVVEIARAGNLNCPGGESELPGRGIRIARAGNPNCPGGEFELPARAIFFV